MKKQALFLFGMLLSTAVYFTSCEDPTVAATAAFEKALGQVDSLKSIATDVDAEFSSVESTYNGLLSQVQGLTNPSETLMNSLQGFGSTLVGQKTALTDVKAKLEEFAGFDIAGLKADAILGQVTAMTSAFGGIGETINGVKTALSSVAGGLGSLTEQVKEQLMAQEAEAAKTTGKKKK